MKIYRQNTLYIQKKDLLYLLKLNLEMPHNLKDNLTRIGLTEENQKDFIRFTAKEEINYYNSFPWIIDYDEYKDFSEEELLELGKEINIQLKSLLCKEKYDTKDNLNEYKKLALKLQSLRDFFWFKRGFANTKIPLECLSRKK